MRNRPLEYYGIDFRRFIVLILLLSLGSGIGVSLATKDVLGSESWIAGALVAVVAGYLVASEPGRCLDVVSLWQAREAPVIAASAGVGLSATGSTSRALLLLGCEEGELSERLEDAKRSVLLGHPPKETVLKSSGGIASDSASRALVSMVTREAKSIEDGGDELESVLATTSLVEETKVPIFIAVSFFAPIMLLLFAMLSRSTTPPELGELVVLELIAVNVAFALSSRERRRLGP